MKEFINKLNFGSWQEILPQIENESIDLIYTDPPYGMNYKSNIAGDKTWNKSGKSDSKFDSIILGDDKNVDWENLAKEFYRILKPNSFVFIHGRIQNMACQMLGELVINRLFHKGTIAWNKKSAVGGGIKTTMKRDWEPIFYFSKGHPSFNPIKVLRKGKMKERKRISEIQDWVFSFQKEDKCGFPTQKPIRLADQIIQLTTKENDTILDPFSGSATFLLSAYKNNRNFIGIEADKKVYDKYKDRPFSTL